MKKAWEIILSNWPTIVAALGMCIFTAGFTWASISTHEARISTLESDDKKREKTLTRTDYNVQLICRKIGLKPLEKSDEENNE